MLCCEHAQHSASPLRQLTLVPIYLSYTHIIHITPNNAQVLRRIKLLPQSSMWPSVRKAIVTEDIRIELLTVLSNDAYRLHYEMFLRNSAAGE